MKILKFLPSLATQRHRKQAILLANRAKEYKEQGDIEKAIAFFICSTELYVYSHEPYHFLGEAFIQRGDLERAKNSFQTAISIDPKFFWSLHCLGLVSFWQGQFSEAIKYFNRAITVDALVAESHYFLGEALSKTGKTIKAIKSHKAAINLNSEFPLSHQALGKNLAISGRLDDAIAAYNTAIRLDPNDAYSYAYLGEALVGKSHYQEAIDCFKEAIKLAPNNSDFYHSLGLVLQQQNKYDEAIAQFKQASLINPNYKPAYRFPGGHFYSPIVNLDDVKAAEERIWSSERQAIGIKFNDESHRVMLCEIFPKYIDDYNYPKRHDEVESDYSFYSENTQFGGFDAKTLFCMLRHLEPSRIIEIGSGFSSLLVADVNRRFLDNQLEFICIEPYPREFLCKGVPGISKLLQQKVEDLPFSTFESLKAGDILFIDSSHVSKTGSDVNYIFFEILPRLAAGVFIHIHDIFLPSDYPKSWVLSRELSWNEQYVVHALLMYTQAFEVVLACNYASKHHNEPARKITGEPFYGGGSLWLRKTVGFPAD